MWDPNQDLRSAAVLVPIVTHAAGPTVLLTRRTEHLPDHAGQIAFPGGRIELSDDGPVMAALRETEEETGICCSVIRPLGRLDTYVTRTGFEVTPVVGLVTPPFETRPCTREVAEIFEVPLAHFFQPGSRQMHSRTYQGRLRHYYAYPYGNYYIWGATAGMLNNLVELLLDQ